MSYNLIAEAPSRIDWPDLQKELAVVRGTVECFPLPHGKPDEPGALGNSLPQQCATPKGWEALSRVIHVLIVDSGMSIFDLCSGSQVTPSGLERLRLDVMGDG